MSNLINELLGKVSSLTQTVNQLLSSSKSIPELPAQATLNGSSLLHVSRAGTSEKISVQQIINAAINNDNDELLSVGAISLSGNNLTIASISGKINNVVQSIATPTEVNIPYCATGLSRVDLIVYNNTNTIVRIAGTETAGAIIVTPTLPLETLLVSQVSVSDSAIGDPTSPILESSYVKKSFSNMFEFNGTGADAIIPLHPSGYSEIRLINAGLTSVSGVDLSLMTGTNFELPYVGKPFIFWNRTGNNISLNNEDYINTDFPLFLTEGSNLIFPHNHFVVFKWDATGLYQVQKSWVDLSAKLDKVSTVDVEKVYVKKADGTQSMKPTSEFVGGNVDTSPKKTSTLYVNGGLNGVVSTSNSFMLFWGNPDGGYFENGNTYLNGMETTLMKSSSSAASSYTSLVWWSPGSTLRTKSKLVGFFAIGSNVLIPDSRTFAGYFQYGYSMNNINYSIAAVAGFLNDTHDANLQFCRLTSSGARVKTDLGSDFPARYTAGQHEYKFLIEVISNFSVSFKIKDLITGASASGTFTDCGIGGTLPMISMAMNNNTTNLQTNLKFTSLIYAENYEF